MYACMCVYVCVFVCMHICLCVCVLAFLSYITSLLHVSPLMQGVGTTSSGVSVYTFDGSIDSFASTDLLGSLTSSQEGFSITLWVNQTQGNEG